MAVQNVNTQGTPAQRNTSAAAANTQSAAKSTNVDKTAAAGVSAVGTNDTARANASGVNISPRAKEMALAKKVVENTPEIREDKVAKYKEMIAKGQYKPDASKITEGIVREAVRDELAKNPEALLAR